jgi:transcriptional regulator with XRE-family HTH domain
MSRKPPQPHVALALKATGSAIRRNRERCGWTQAQLAKRTNVTVSTVSLLESGKRGPSIELLARLAGLFGVGIAGLLPGGPDDV